MKASILIISAVILSGCASPMDMPTVLMLSDRLKALENSQINKPMPTPAPIPMAAPVPVPVFEDVIIFWVTNTNESVSPIRIIKKGGKFIGPKGEEYSTQPTQRQIERLYRL